MGKRDTHTHAHARTHMGQGQSRSSQRRTASAEADGLLGVRWERRRGQHRPQGLEKHMVTWRPVAPTSQTWLCQEHSVSHGAGSEQDGGVQVGAWPGRRSWSSACQTAWDRVVTCLGPVNTQPKGLLSHAYEIGGSTEVLAPIMLGHIGQAEACVGLHTLTDPGLRG